MKGGLSRMLPLTTLLFLPEWIIPSQQNAVKAKLSLSGPERALK
jgi:hypothetical protein